MQKEMLKQISKLRKDLDILEEMIKTQEAPPPKILNPELAAEAARVIEAFNQKCGTSYQTKAEGNLKLIIAKINKGYSFEDFVLVIEDRKSLWKNDKKMCEYLRPKTVFGANFESYINAARSRVTDKTFREDDIEKEILRRMTQ